MFVPFEVAKRELANKWLQPFTTLCYCEEAIINSLLLSYQTKSTKHINEHVTHVYSQ